MPFIVHHLGDRVYGFWSLATAFVGYYNLLDLGLSSAISQYMCIAIGQKNHNECRVVFNTALRLQLLIGGAALVATPGWWRSRRYSAITRRTYPFSGA